MSLRTAVFFLSLCVLVLGSTPTLAEWQEQVSAEAEAKLDCDVAYLSHVVERTVDGKSLVMVKVHCMDQRSFDAVRYDRMEPFKFEECTTREKKSC